MNEKDASEARDHRRTPSRRSLIIRAILACGLVLGLGSVGTLASWTSGAGAKPGPLKSAQLDVVANGHLASSSNLDGLYVETSWVFDEMLPGEFVGVVFTASNSGSSQMPLDLRVDAYVEGAAAPAMAFTIYEGGTPAVTTPSNNVSWNTFRQANCTGGAQIGADWRHVGTGAANATTLVPTKKRLNVGDSVKYCVRVTMSGGATFWEDTTLLNTTGTAVFKLRGTQVGAP